MDAPGPRRELRQQCELPALLVVDDEPVLCDLVADLLEGSYEVSSAATAEAALARLAQKPAAVVLTDVRLPGMDGIGLLSTLKERDPEQPVVVMTGLSDRDLVVRALQAGADDFIDKPVKALQLRTTVARALERRSLRAQVHRLGHLEQMHSQFLGLVSHKLKTPVTAISLLLQNLARGADHPSHTTLHLALGEAAHLAHLIEDLLYFSHAVLHSDSLRPEPLELNRIATQAMMELREAAQRRGIALQTRLDTALPAVSLDRNRTLFAFRALLDNAIKFSPDGGSVTLVSRCQGDGVELLVRDGGPGIPEAEREKVFQRFHQIDPAGTGQVRGFGLGLYYAREFARQQGGEVRLLSCPGEGTTAVLRFPLPATP